MKTNPTSSNTARAIRKNLADLDLQSLPLWPSHLVQEAFLRIRDTRFLSSENQPDFKRRIPWLFPDNGCFLRAALIRRMLAEWNFPPIKKIFCFGDMKFQSSWSMTGHMTYKDHVAVILRTSSDSFVLDPPVSFARPLSFNDWIQALHENGKVAQAKFSICNALTVAHNSPSNEMDPHQEIAMRSGMMRPMEFFTAEFLTQEWNRIQDLGLDPERVLGDHPPW